jgi:3-oxoacyl-[acyl-carrier protein] reductase
LKAVVVTGVSRGLGLAICADLIAAGGYHVIGVSRSLSPAYQALIEASAGRGEFHACDLGDLDAIPPLASGILARHPVIWGLVNNAGMALDGLLTTMRRSDMERVLTVNLTAPLLLTKHLSRSMLSARAGRVVNISSIISGTGFTGLSAYAASKAGLEGMSRSLAREFGKRNVTVNCVAPGYMPTEMTSGYNEEQLGSIRRRAAVGIVEPADAAHAVTFLLSPEAGRITGAVIKVDGGSTA